MNPLNLKLKNFSGIRAGLGLNEIEINFAAIEGELIAITGETGRGKTTILDSCHPYRLMPSRATSYSPGSFSYYDHTFDNASKELEFEHDGHVYRSILKIKGGKTKKTEAYLQVQRSSSWVPLNDGKTATYDAALAEVMGTPELYFTSAFACQNRPLLANYTNGDIKSMLAELLNLESIKELGLKAKNKRDAAKNMLEDLQAQALKADADTEELETAEKRLAEAEDTARIAADDVTAQETKVQGLRADLVRAQEQVKGQEATVTRRCELEDAMAKARAAGEAVNAEHDAQVRRIDTDTNRTKDSTVQIIGIAIANIGKLKKQLAQAKEILDRKDEIDASANNLKALVSDEKKIQVKLAEAREAKDRIAAFNTTATDLKNKIHGIERHIEQLTRDIDAADRRGALIDEVPCTTVQDYVSTCPLLADARKGIAGKEALISTKGQAQTDLETEQTELQAVLGKIAAFPSPRIHEIEATLNDNRIEQKRCSELAALKTQLESAEVCVSEVPTQIEADQKTIVDAEQRLQSVMNENQAQIEHVSKKRDEDIAEYRNAYAEAQEKLKDMPDVEAININAIDAMVAAGVTELNELKEKHIEIRERVSRLEADIDIKKKNTMPAANGELEAAEFDLAQWKLLTKALGNDGIISLSIDDAGPTIASIENDLLLACFGPRYTVKIVTQTETATGILKENFDIVVFDAETNEEKSVAVLSGGQTTYINEILTRAIGLFQAQNSGQSYGCLFADESDGGLDAEKKVEFMKMKREVLKVGGYKREYFISHTPSLWSLADAVINVDQMVVRMEKAA